VLSLFDCFVSFKAVDKIQTCLLCLYYIAYLIVSVYLLFRDRWGKFSVKTLFTICYWHGSLSLETEFLSGGVVSGSGDRTLWHRHGTLSLETELLYLVAAVGHSDTDTAHYHWKPSFCVLWQRSDTLAPTQHTIIGNLIAVSSSGHQILWHRHGTLSLKTELLLSTSLSTRHAFIGNPVAVDGSGERTLWH
jgi:hypothetical protein